MKTQTEIRRLLEIGLEEDNNEATLGTGERVESNTALVRETPVTLKDVLADITNRYAPHLPKGQAQ